VVELVERGGEWSVITKDLLALITPEHPPRSWPRSPHSLAGRLRHAAPALRQIGIEVVRPGRDVNRKRDRRIVIRKVAETIVRNVRTSETLDFERKNGTMPRTMPDDADEVSKTIVHSDNRVSGPQTPLSDDVDDVDDAAAYLSDCDTFTCDHEIPADYLDDEEEAAERGVV
jgi:hypothetical protein